MKTRLIVIILLIIACSINLLAQKSDKDKINQFDDKGQKTGLWVDTIHNIRLRETYYKNGLKSGIFKQYNLNGRLFFFGEYCEDKRCGTWYSFEYTGHLYALYKDFSKNTYAITSEVTGEKFVPDYNCYSVSFHLNGTKESEGLLLWDEGETPESDFSTQYGEWKYYDESGKLIETKNYTTTQTFRNSE